MVISFIGLYFIGFYQPWFLIVTSFCRGSEREREGERGLMTCVCWGQISVGESMLYSCTSYKKQIGLWWIKQSMLSLSVSLSHIHTDTHTHTHTHTHSRYIYTHTHTLLSAFIHTWQHRSQVSDLNGLELYKTHTGHTWPTEKQTK